MGEKRNNCWVRGLNSCQRAIRRSVKNHYFGLGLGYTDPIITIIKITIQIKHNTIENNNESNENKNTINIRKIKLNQDTKPINKKQIEHETTL